MLMNFCFSRFSALFCTAKSCLMFNPFWATLACLFSWKGSKIFHGLPFSIYAKFPINYYFLPPDTHTYEGESGGKKCLYFGKLCLRTKCMDPYVA